jgi:hypothetical protein
MSSNNIKCNRTLNAKNSVVPLRVSKEPELLACYCEYSTIANKLMTFTLAVEGI